MKKTTLLILTTLLSIFLYTQNLSWSHHNIDYAVKAEPGKGYLLMTNTKEVTFMLPSDPSMGDMTGFLDVSGTFEQHAVTVDPGGNLINGQFGIKSYNTSNDVVVFIWSNSPYGWKQYYSASSGLSGGNSSLISNVVIDYGASGDGSTDDATAFSNAFSENNDVFVPASSNPYKISSLTIPEGKRIFFESGAMIDVTSSLLINGEIQAGLNQIFTISSAEYINADNAKFKTAYPEWFGAKGDNLTQSADAINNTLKVFKRADLTGKWYVINSTIEMLEEDLPDGVYPYYGTDVYTISMGENTGIMIDMALSDEPLFYITAQPVKIQGGNIYTKVGYTGWIYDIHPHPTASSADWRFRIGSTFKNTSIRGVNYSSDDQNGLAFNGIKIESDKADDYSYFSSFDNIYMRRCDTAISGVGHDGVSGMINGYQFSNITIDGSARGIHQDADCAGWSFSNLMYQPNNDDNRPAITTASSYNTYQGEAWDYAELYLDGDGELNPTRDTMIVFQGSGANNRAWMGQTDMGAYTLYNSSNRRTSTQGQFYRNFDFYNVAGYGVKWNAKDGSSPTHYYQLNGATKTRLTQVSGITYYHPESALGVHLGKTDRPWATFYSDNISDDGNGVTIDNFLRLTPQSSAPSSPAEGTVYVNSTDDHVYIYLNSTWKQIDN